MAVGFRVQGQDGVPSVSNVTKIQFDQADGFDLTTEDVGIARIDFVYTGTQTDNPGRGLAFWSFFSGGG